MSQEAGGRGKTPGPVTSAAPSGAAGGDLTGTYPNPTVKASVALTTPNIGAATATSINGNTITTGTGTLTLGAGKTTTFDHTSTFTTTDGQTYTFPTTSATLARTDAANTFTGASTATNWNLNAPAITGAMTGTGNYIPVTLLNSGTSASASTFWRGDGTWAAASGSSFSPTSSVFLYDELIGVQGIANFTPFGPLSLEADTSGTGASVGAPSAQDTSAPGQVGLITGTTTTGFAGFLTNNSSATKFQGGVQSIEWRVRIPTLSDGTDRFTVRSGFNTDITTNGDTTQVGLWFKYADNVNSGKWLAVTGDGTSTSTSDAGTTVAANTWYRLKVEMNAAGDLATFYINGVLATTINTHLPALASAPGIVIYKSLGTTSRKMDVDYAYWTFAPTGR